MESRGLSGKGSPPAAGPTEEKTLKQTSIYRYAKTLRTKEQILWKKREAEWKRICSTTHKLFCNCGDFSGHLARQYKWCTKPIGHEYKKGGSIAADGGGGHSIGDAATITGIDASPLDPEPPR